MDSETAWPVRRVVLSALFLLVVAVPLYPELFGLDEVTPFTQLAAFRPQELVVLLVVALLMLIRRGWRLAAALVLLLTVTGMGLTAPRVFSDPGSPEPGTRELTVMVANVLAGGADAGELAKVIRDRRPDVVSLPEAQVDVRRELEAHLQDLGYHGFTEQANASAVSATSVLVAPTLGSVRFETEQATTTFANVIVTGGSLGDLRLIAYHAYPPLLDAVTTWKQDLLALRWWCGQTQPTVVAGDFNATTDHAAFRDALGSGCRSVAPSAGAGLQGTWPSNRPALVRTQIDHVVVSDGITPGRFSTYEIDGTDHLAAVATVAVRNQD